MLPSEHPYRLCCLTLPNIERAPLLRRKFENQYFSQMRSLIFLWYVSFSEFTYQYTTKISYAWRALLYHFIKRLFNLQILAQIIHLPRSHLKSHSSQKSSFWNLKVFCVTDMLPDISSLMDFKLLEKMSAICIIFV